MHRSFKREIEALNEVFGFTAEFAGANRISRSDSFAVNVAVEEIFTNIVKYAARSVRDVSIHLERRGGDLIIKITDFDVEPFDVTKTERAEVGGALRERGVGGIGLHLVHNVVDRVTYEYEDSNACVTLVKRVEGGDV